MHIGETVAAELRRHAAINACIVHLQRQLSLHAGHGVDLPGNAWHEERVHHGGRGQPEMHRTPDWQRQFIDRGDVLLRVDEHPFPVHRHHFDSQRWLLRFEWLVRIELVRAGPRQGGQEQDHQQRNDPNGEFDAAGVTPCRAVGRAAIGRAEPPREHQGQHDDRHHHHQHAGQRLEQQLAFLGSDRAMHREHAFAATSKQRHKNEYGQRAPPWRHCATSVKGRRCHAGIRGQGNDPLK